MADQIQIRRDTASNWTSNNPILAAGEQGWESDTNKMKVGDGSTAWTSLGYFVSQTGLESGDIGSTVQAYDADTAKYDDATANFTGTLQNGGSNVVVDTDIGSAVQAYDSNLTSFVSAFTLPTTDGTANQILTTNGSGTLSFADVTSSEFEKSYRYTGTLETNTGSLRLYLHKAATLTEIDLFVNTAPSGSSINLDINKNGTSVATPSIAADSTSNTGISANVSFAEGDYITVDIDQVGSSTAGSDLYAVLTFT